MVGDLQVAIGGGGGGGAIVDGRRRVREFAVTAVEEFERFRGNTTHRMGGKREGRPARERQRGARLLLSERQDHGTAVPCPAV